MNTTPKISDNVTRVFLDPDGSGGDVFGVTVQRATGVAYGTQCEGLKSDERYVEGFFEAWVPVLTPQGPGVLVWPNCD
jgi:hypothetical protein